MKVSALRAVFSGTEWLTAAQVGELAGLSQANRSGAANRWKQKRKLFALPHEGQDHYPRYLLDNQFRPLPSIEKVLEELQGFTPSRLASWFESTTGLLGGKRPREVLASDPVRVIEAARRTLDAEQAKKQLSDLIEEGLSSGEGRLRTKGDKKDFLAIARGEIDGSPPKENEFRQP